MCVSPVALTVRSTRECLAKAVSRWSKKGTVVEMLDLPVPSRFRLNSIDDSEVERLMDAVLLTVWPFARTSLWDA
jgi:hypothetical protein